MSPETPTSERTDLPNPAQPVDEAVQTLTTYTDRPGAEVLVDRTNPDAWIWADNAVSRTNIR